MIMNDKNLTTWACVFARKGSKGILGKNTKLINGRSLIERAVDKAKSVSSVDRVFVSTDCPKISSLAIAAGAEVPFLRPSELSTDESPELLSWKHMVEYWQNEIGQLPDVFVSVPAVCPLAIAEDVANTIDRFVGGKAELALTVTEDRSVYHAGKIEGDSFEFFLETNKARRQDFPKAYKVVAACYATSPDFILRTKDLRTATISPVPIPIERSIDIDTPFDFTVAENLLKGKEAPSAK